MYVNVRCQVSGWMSKVVRVESLDDAAEVLIETYEPDDIELPLDLDQESFTYTVLED